VTGLKLPDCLRKSCALLFLTLLTACGALSPTSPGMNDNMASSGLTGVRSGAKKETLLYISWSGGVNVYSYPSDKQEISLTGFQSPEGLCSDKAGNVFVTDTEAQAVYEFAHGGTAPIATLYDNNAEFNAFGCSVDPTTNNLAVTSADSNDVFIFKNEAGTPSIVNNPYAYGYFCTYDGSGNLFTRGTNDHVAELPRGTTEFQNIKLSEAISDVVGFAWDGKLLSIDGDIPTNVNYRIRVHESRATVVSKSGLLGAKFVVQFTIFNNQLIGPDQNANQVSFWKYPSGGNPVKTIAGLELPQGSTISLAR
jgi:hypothetical protein